MKWFLFFHVTNMILPGGNVDPLVMVGDTRYAVPFERKAECEAYGKLSTLILENSGENVRVVFECKPQTVQAKQEK